MDTDTIMPKAQCPWHGNAENTVVQPIIIRDFLVAFHALVQYTYHALASEGQHCLILPYTYALRAMDFGSHAFFATD